MESRMALSKFVSAWLELEVNNNYSWIEGKR